MSSNHPAFRAAPPLSPRPVTRTLPNSAALRYRLGIAALPNTCEHGGAYDAPGTRGSPHAAEEGMLAAQRRGLILDAVLSETGAGVVELAQRFSVSEMTVRRDLAQLAR